MNKILNERELALELGLSAWTVRRMRLQERCPHFKVGSRIFYQLETVLVWIKEKETMSTSSEDDCEPGYGKIRPIK